MAGEGAKRKQRSGHSRDIPAKRQKRDTSINDPSAKITETDIPSAITGVTGKVPDSVNQCALSVEGSALPSQSSSSSSSGSRTEETQSVGAGDAQGHEPYLCTGYDMYVTKEPCTM